MVTLNQKISRIRKKYLNISVDWNMLEKAYEEIDFNETIADAYLMILDNASSKNEIEDDSIEQTECWNFAADLTMLKLSHNKKQLYEL